MDRKSQDDIQTIEHVATDFVVTATHLIRGTIPQNLFRLSDYLEGFTRPFVQLDDAEIIEHSSGRRQRVEQALVRKTEILLAHEYENTCRDPRMVVETSLVRATLWLTGFEKTPLRGFVQERNLASPPSFFTVTNFCFESTDRLPAALVEEIQGREHAIVQRDQISLIAARR